MYVCGITPYDSTHMGHTATYLMSDLLVRAWRDAGLEVAYVQNVTDIDDPLFERSAQTGEDWTELAERQTELFRDDMAALRVLPPDHFVGATEVVPLIAAAVEKLGVHGATYPVNDDLYFDVESDARFGEVSGWTRDQMLEVFADRGGDPDRPGKRHPLDSLLWLSQRSGEPGWEVAGLATGRPGWHVECTAIALEYLGAGFDVQAGGSDLVFPHHQMCASQAEVLAGPGGFARAYVHQGMVGLDGEKMSKSKGNLVFSSQLRADGVDPMAIRFAVLGHHYRTEWEWTDADLQHAEQRLARLRRAVSASSGPDAGPVLAGVREALADDLDAPRALSFLDSWAHRTLENGGSDHDAPGIIAAMSDALLGIRI